MNTSGRFFVVGATLFMEAHTELSQTVVAGETTKWPITSDSCNASPVPCEVLLHTTKARFSRDHLARARTQGPRAMAAAIRAVLKHGRRYKAPPGRPPLYALFQASSLLMIGRLRRPLGSILRSPNGQTACDFGELHTVQTHIPDRVVIEALPSPH